MQVGAERERAHAGVEHALGHLEGKMRAVADVDAHAARDGLEHDGVDLAFLGDEAAGMAGEGMRQDVARLHDRHQFADQFVGVRHRAFFEARPQLAEVDVERQPGLPRDLAAGLDHLQPPARLAADLGMRLDAAHDVEVLLGDAHGVIDVDAVRAVEIGIEMTLKAADQVAGDEAQQSALRGFGQVVAEAAERHATRPALVDERGDAGTHADHVGVEAELAGDVFVDMGVGVDHAGGDDLAGEIDALARGGLRQVGRDGGDLAAGDGDVAAAVHAGCRIDQRSAREQDVIRKLQRVHDAPPHAGIFVSIPTNWPARHDQRRGAAAQKFGG